MTAAGRRRSPGARVGRLRWDRIISLIIFPAAFWVALIFTFSS
ncbi:hypothetical protein [Brevundimonas vesicularis]|nr:hypothetical protein [Brevundimonas vesicularis]